MTLISGKLYRAAAAALVLVLGMLNGAEVDLLSLLPSHSAIAGYANCAKLQNNQLFRDFNTDGIKQAAFSLDERGKRISVLFHFSNEKAWQKMWEQISPYIEPMPAERRIMLFKVKNNGKFYRNGHFAVLAPMVAAYYADYPENQPFRCDYSGISAALRKQIPVANAATAGTTRIKKDPFRQIRNFRAELTGTAAAPLLKGEITCRQPIHASLTHFALLTACSVWLQEYCNLTPENAAEIISLIKVRQDREKLLFEFRDFTKLAAFIAAGTKNCY